MRDKDKLLNLYISCIEKIANGRTNELHFEQHNMSFYRGEIHIIKFIGDNPGIISQHIADMAGVTKAVIHKTLIKLIRENYVIKVIDEEDRKRKKLFLTERGKAAYRLHKEYHEKNDADFMAMIKTLDKNETEVIIAFLEQVQKMITHHF